MYSPAPKSKSKPFLDQVRWQIGSKDKSSLPCQRKMNERKYKWRNKSIWTVYFSHICFKLLFAFINSYSAIWWNWKNSLFTFIFVLMFKWALEKLTVKYSIRCLKIDWREGNLSYKVHQTLSNASFLCTMHRNRTSLKTRERKYST